MSKKNNVVLFCPPGLNFNQQSLLQLARDRGIESQTDQIHFAAHTIKNALIKARNSHP